MKRSVDSRRLYLAPMTEWELQKRVNEGHEGLEEVIAACRRHPDHWIWYTLWMVCSKENGLALGTLRFDGLPQGGVLSVTCTIGEAYRRQGYGTEALQTALTWAYKMGEVYFTRVQVGEEDEAAAALLRKLKFQPVPGKEGQWILERPRVKWLTGYLLLGFLLGVLIGTMLHAAPTGALIGTIAGAVCGVALLLFDLRKRRKLREKLLSA